MGRHGRPAIPLPAHIMRGLTVLNGIFGVRKPEGESSARTVERVKRRLIDLLLQGEEGEPEGAIAPRTGSVARELGRRLKVGHGGTLDPIATGVLVIGLGEGCKRLAGFLGGVTKKYRATGRLGRAYDTYDRTGVVMKELPWTGEQVTEGAIANLLRERFTGTIQQRPPLFSAIHINGERAYEVARRRQKEHLAGAGGTTVPDQQAKAESNDMEGAANDEEGEERRADRETPVSAVAPGSNVQLVERPVTIHQIRLSSCNLPEFVLDMECNSGTYVRSLIHDLGEALGTAAAMWELERTAQGSIELKDCLTIEDIVSIGMLKKHLK